MHDHRGASSPVEPRCFDDLLRGHAANLRRHLWCVSQSSLFRFGPSICASSDELLVDQAFFNQDKEHAVCESNISAGSKLQMNIALARRRRLTRINNDPTAAAITLLPQELVEDRKSLRGVCSGEQQDFSERDVIP